MKATEIRKDVLEYIASDIQKSVSRLGINTTVSFSLNKDKLEMSSTPFQTMPMIFKSVYLWGRVLVDEEHGAYTTFTVMIYYGYKHWDGGNNACALGTVQYNIDNKMPAGFSEYCTPNIYIKKSRGIEI